MPAPFEDPKKTALVKRTEVAVDKAGFVRIEPAQPIDCDGLTARLKGDVQSLDSEDIVRCYYVVPTALKTLPTWIGEFARVAHAQVGVGVYVVFALDAFDEAVLASCKAAGAGVLTVSIDDDFVLVEDFFGSLPAPVAEEFRASVSDVRRKLESKLDQQRKFIEQNIQSVRQLTEQMEDKKAEEYRAALEESSELLRVWSEDLSRDLDEVLVSMDSTKLESIAALVDQGPPAPAGPDEAAA